MAAEFVEFELYKGRVKGKYYPVSHRYYIGGKPKAGVTTYLGIKDKSEALKSYVREQTVKHLLPAFRAGKKISEKELVEALYIEQYNTKEAADLGTRIHDWCEAYINHRISPKKYTMPEMPEDPAVVTGASAFLEWEAAHKVKFVWSEKVLYSLKHDYIGKGDFAAIVDGILCLCDLKTGNGMYNSVRGQTAAYAMADMEESGAKYKGRWAIRLAKETKEEYEERMALKNEIRGILGKDPVEVEPYQVFEAIYLDVEKDDLKKDFQWFLDHVGVYRRDKETDFWKIKNGRAV